MFGRFQSSAPSSSRPPTHKAPHPALFAAVTLLAFGTFAVLVRHRAETAPASARPRLNDHVGYHPNRKEELERYLDKQK